MEWERCCWRFSGAMIRVALSMKLFGSPCSASYTYSDSDPYSL